MKQDQYRQAAAAGRARPSGRAATDIRPRIHDDDQHRAKALQLCQERLDAWLALPRDADDKAVDKARAGLQEALGILGAVTSRRQEVSPFVGRRPAAHPTAGVATILR